MSRTECCLSGPVTKVCCIFSKEMEDAERVARGLVKPAPIELPVMELSVPANSSPELILTTFAPIK